MEAKKNSMKMWLLTAIFALSSCTTESMISKKWEIDIEAQKEHIEALSQQKGGVLEGMFGELKKGLAQSFLENTKMDFQDEGVLQVSIMGQNLTGNWEIDKDGKTLRTNVGGVSSSYKIIECGMSKLVLEGSGLFETQKGNGEGSNKLFFRAAE